MRLRTGPIVGILSVAFVVACVVVGARSMRASESRYVGSVAASVVLVTCDGNSGCGVVTERGVLTAWHVVRGAAWITVRGTDGREARATSWARLAFDTDVALVRFAAGALPWRPVPVCDGVPPHGAPVAVVATWGRARDENLRQLAGGHSFGAFAFRSRYGTAWLAASVPVQPGFSGAPLIWEGAVCGIVSLETCDLGVNLFARVRP